MSLQELYDQSIRPLPPADGLRLATLILNDIAPESVVDYSDEWSDEDYRDFSNAGWRHIEKALGEAGDA